MIAWWMATLIGAAQAWERRQRRPMTRPVRTDMDCHSCRRSFIAQLDFALDGCHVIECPTCAHLHYRIIEAGVVTGDRWHSDGMATHTVAKRCVWKADSRPIVTSTAAAFLRDKWLNRSDLPV